MGFADDILKKIFSSTKTTSKSIKGDVKTVERLVRSYHFQADYEKWINHPETKVKLSALYENLKLSYQGISASMEVGCWKNNSATGFVIYPTVQLQTSDYPFLLDWFKHKTKALGYRLYHANKQVEGHKTTESYYLKPQLAYDEAQTLLQQFGNILLELVWEGEKILYLKGLITIYHGRNYSDAKSFDDYLSNILKP